jgi:hypothetical protein
MYEEQESPDKGQCAIHRFQTAASTGPGLQRIALFRGLQEDLHEKNSPETKEHRPEHKPTSGQDLNAALKWAQTKEGDSVLLEMTRDCTPSPISKWDGMDTSHCSLAPSPKVSTVTTPAAPHWTQGWGGLRNPFRPWEGCCVELQLLRCQAGVCGKCQAHSWGTNVTCMGTFLCLWQHWSCLLSWWLTVSREARLSHMRTLPGQAGKLKPGRQFGANLGSLKVKDVLCLLVGSPFLQWGEMDSTCSSTT